MKDEKIYFVIMKPGDVTINNETVFLSSGNEGTFTNNIREAEKCVGRKTALIVKNDYELNKNDGYESNLKIVPLKITYEW